MLSVGCELTAGGVRRSKTTRCLCRIWRYEREVVTEIDDTCTRRERTKALLAENHQTDRGTGLLARITWGEKGENCVSIEADQDAAEICSRVCAVCDRLPHWGQVARPTRGEQNTRKS